MEEPTAAKENEKKYRNRFLGKLFKQEKQPSSELEVDDFLHGSSDKLYMMPTSTNTFSPTPLTRIDTASASRWPSAAEINTSIRTKDKLASGRQSRKGLAVRFYDGQPEVIGEGGDESTAPVAEIGVRKRAQARPTYQVPDSLKSPTSIASGQGTPEQRGSLDTFRPRPISRTQTGYASVPDQLAIAALPKMPAVEGTQQAESSDRLAEPDRRSFAEKVKAEMQSEEGLTLVRAAARNSVTGGQVVEASDPDHDDSMNFKSQSDELHMNTMNNVEIPISPEKRTDIPPQPQETLRDLQPPNGLTENPAGITRTSTLSHARTVPTTRLQNVATPETLAHLQRAPTLTLQEAAMAVGDDALQEFSERTAHLLTLFRLSTEATKPLPKCSLNDLIRAGLWWLVKGRMDIEATIRDRPASPEAQQTNFLRRQQAYANLAKSLWLLDAVISTFPEIQLRSESTNQDPKLADIIDCQQATLSGLKKLTMSMKRNNFLPPNADDAPLPQGLDSTIWMQGTGDKSLLASQRLPTYTLLSEMFPLGDTTHSFSFGRMFLEAILAEEGAPNEYRCPVLLSLIRPRKEKYLKAVVVSQDGSLNVVVGSDKSSGPTWADLRWQAKQNMIEIRLPRGVSLRIFCSESDFRMIWAIYDHEDRTHVNMLQRPGEKLMFETTVPFMQYFVQSSHPVFSKEPQPQCCLRVYEKSFVEKAAAGPRTMHRGYRVCLMTHPKTKNLRGIDQDLHPNLPTLFNFLRGDEDLPAFMLKFYDLKVGDSATMVLTLNDNQERGRLHMLLTDVYLRDAENVVAEATMKEFSMTARKDMIPPCLKSLEWQGFRFINQDRGELQTCQTVLSEQLRVALDFKIGTITDRINIGPGELRLRLDVTASHELKVLRQPQEDMTISLSESQAPKHLAKDLAVLLNIIRSSSTTRIYTFPTSAELHLFQHALTGYKVLFDGIATSFSISRRRMVVPIYKKWDAAPARLQVVQREKVIQLLAFFQNFSHGDCMNFTLKSTDVFESSNRGGKYSLRIVDAKFALPEPRGEEGIEHEFVCLDEVPFPAEHDDIQAFFENESVLESFTRVLPAPAKIASRMASVRR